MKKKPFILLEMIVGIALAALLIGFLFSTFKQTALASSKLKPAQKVVHQRACLQLRLFALFDRFEFERHKIDFYTAAHPESLNEALYFSFKQTVDPDPHFVGILNAAIFLKHPEKTLCLDTFSTDGRRRREVFLENLKELSFQFIDAQKGKLESHWPQGGDFSPALLKISVLEKEGKTPVDFGFSLKSPTEIIYFKETK